MRRSKLNGDMFIEMLCRRYHGQIETDKDILQGLVTNWIVVGIPGDEDIERNICRKEFLVRYIPKYHSKRTKEKLFAGLWLSYGPKFILDFIKTDE